MTQITRRSVLGAAVFTAVVPVVASHDRAVAADAEHRVALVVAVEQRARVGLRVVAVDVEVARIALVGRDEEAVLGHCSEDNILDIFFGEEYEKLREQHRTGDYPDFCKNCDFLIDDPEVLVYTNHERDLMKMHGTNFTLNDYRD